MIAVALALLLQAPAAPASAEPQWLRLPSRSEVAKAYPRARADGQPGSAMLSCEVANDGALFGCVVMNESPAGKGFGAAALRLSRLYRMQPVIREGVPAPGGSVLIPIRWPRPNPDQ